MGTAISALSGIVDSSKMGPLELVLSCLHSGLSVYYLSYGYRMSYLNHIFTNIIGFFK